MALLPMKLHITTDFCYYWRTMSNTLRQTKLFTKTRKETPSDEVSKNAQLLIRAGYIHKEMAGVYTWLPLGLRTFNNIVSVIREEMNAVGGQEVRLTGLQDPEVWKPTERWDDEVVDAWFKTQLKNGTELGLGFTHEEPLTRLMRDHVSSYKDLPKLVYQFQTKFRNEARAKSGIMRTREFVMKDLYSFARTQEEHDELYNVVAEAYTRVFQRVGLGDTTYKTFASGGVFSKYSHEYQTLTSAGEDIVYVNKEKGIAINKEVYSDEVLADLGVSKDELTEEKASEVGNIFSLGTRFSEALNLVFKSEAGEATPVIMGSYGIGPARVMGVIAELLSDENGLVWPESVAPFAYHLIVLDSEANTEVREEADRLFAEMEKRNISVLYDDREARAGEKFADADLIGIPKRIIVSEKTLAEGQFELVTRSNKTATFISEQDILAA